ncbi:MAG TPA: GntR family transcriptional regulator [Candidatus Hungatella pullicola]|nr:GntR family transcriptional regulator [Candidatus Hungatella pullicola]
MKWHFENNRPIYSQILEQIRLGIISGEFSAGSRLPSVRELAAEASVNPNTMQKALSELEQSKIIYSQRTSGRFVTEDQSMIEQIKQEIAETKIKEFIQTMQELGISPDEVLKLIEKTAKEMIS